ncbi:HAL/PAL/TAL family ammonia-lyase [Pararhodobacter zhoushanensis]|uniref:HAL/PAL/TAL family ammonia-lyase n=1 Tax=Pararhodobacter zhoushanensis TaxID=2479545 RepID=UPI000F8DA221|nr:aromatic amino acid ammonia-lyase [Pararhodobacter zhoushanensis]
MIIVSGEGLGLDEIVAVSKGAKIALTTDAAVLGRIEASQGRIEAAVNNGEQVYGVTTLYGGMADQYVPVERMVELQHIALWHHKTATGPRLPAEDVRAAMLLRINSLMKGYSGVRLELIERYVTFLNAGVTPHAFQRGSIGASGDLVPLSYIGASVIGLDPAFLVDWGDEVLDCVTALKRLGLAPLTLRPKEGLAMNNGTTASTGVAANAMGRATMVLALGLNVQALLAEALLATNQSFHATIQAIKPHAGQVFIGKLFRDLLDGSSLIRSEAAGERGHRSGKLIQDRYSLRCLPQYTGPIVDMMAVAAQQITVEANSANDNPLVDPDTGEVYHTGNFLAQYTGVAMDTLRAQLAMLLKHLDVQIAMLVTPEFNNGLPASLVGNTAHGLNMGLKSLQLTCNSVAPLVQFYGRSMVDLYPSHAEQFNQNINSQAMNAANLARDSVDACEHFLAAALVFAVQAVELRANTVRPGYDASDMLSTRNRAVYAAARTAALGAPDADKPLLWNDTEGFIQDKVEGILTDLRSGSLIRDALTPTLDEVSAFLNG